MASESESAFNKRLTAESTMDKVEGLLEHFNLPPKAITFIRANQRIIQISLAILIAAVVIGSLYGSYRQKVREEAASALAKAMELQDDGKAEALRKVAEEYSSTASALWAKVDLAHLDMKNGAFADAGEKYRKVLVDLKKDNPLYPLVLFGIAQSFEADKKYEEAATQYDLLKNIKGFEHIGYAGMGRIEESQGNIDKAIAIHNNFLLSIGDDPSFAQAREEITAKIARLKARQ
jgi:predicted negative regulator of RcsB-dependent stress response